MISEKFLEFKGKPIYYTCESGTYWVALKPICEALGVSWEKQRHKFKEKENMYYQLPTNWGGGCQR